MRTEVSVTRFGESAGHRRTWVFSYSEDDLELRLDRYYHEVLDRSRNDWRIEGDWFRRHTKGSIDLTDVPVPDGLLGDIYREAERADLKVSLPQLRRILKAEIKRHHTLLTSKELTARIANLIETLDIDDRTAARILRIKPSQVKRVRARITHAQPAG